jgi:drug/metabolite transporter (DMT)-like permease
VRTFICFAVLILAGTAGDLSITRAMKQGAEVVALVPVDIGRAIAGALRRRWMWIGIAFHAIAFGSVLALLSWHDVSVVVPASALSYIVGALGARFFLKEHVDMVRWAGVLLIAGGVTLVLAG